MVKLCPWKNKIKITKIKRISLNANSTSNYTTSLFAKISLMDEFYFFAERMACCCHLQAHLSAHLQAHLQAHFVYATLI